MQIPSIRDFRLSRLSLVSNYFRQSGLAYNTFFVNKICKFYFYGVLSSLPFYQVTYMLIYILFYSDIFEHYMEKGYYCYLKMIPSIFIFT